MRTTVTLDPDVSAFVSRAMKERGVTFKQAINEAIRRGMTDGEARPAPDFPTYNLGRPKVDLTKALQLAGSLEDEEIVRKLGQGK